jgi:hypothetical protein
MRRISGRWQESTSCSVNKNDTPLATKCRSTMYVSRLVKEGYHKMTESANHAFTVGRRVCLAKPDEYHLHGVIVGAPGFIDPDSGTAHGFYSIDFQCADNHIENLWLEEGEIQTLPIVVCLCGSTRFSAAFREANLRETLDGKIVLSIGCDMRSDQDIFGHLSADELMRVKARLDELHLRKIDLADEILVLNVGGYVGESTSREIAYAQAIGKSVRYLESLNAG